MSKPEIHVAGLLQGDEVDVRFCTETDKTNSSVVVHARMSDTPKLGDRCPDCGKEFR